MPSQRLKCRAIFDKTVAILPLPTSEHAFQALKTDDHAEREKVRFAKTPAAAKVLGKRVTPRVGWDRERFEVMERVVRAKFADLELAVKLLATGERELIEGNTWRNETYGKVRQPATVMGQTGRINL